MVQGAAGGRKPNVREKASNVLGVVPEATAGQKRPRKRASVEISPLPAQSEKSWQADVEQLARILGWRTFHVNQVARCPDCGSRAVARAIPPGWPDLVLVKPNRHILFVELKSDTGKTTPEQDGWLDAIMAARHGRSTVWRPKDLAEVQRELERIERPEVSVYPGMMSGQPCLDEHRLTCEQFAEYVWNGMEDEIYKGWDYLTRDDVLVMCWYQARYGSRAWQKRWKAWLERYSGKLWYSADWESVPMPPSKGEKP